jgi:hypothetical protein
VCWLGHEDFTGPRRRLGRSGATGGTRSEAAARRDHFKAGESMEGVGGGSAFGGGGDGMEAALRRPMEAGLHRKVTGEGQDRRSEEILEGNEGE